MRRVVEDLSGLVRELAAEIVDFIQLIGQFQRSDGDTPILKMPVLAIKVSKILARSEILLVWRQVLLAYDRWLQNAEDQHPQGRCRRREAPHRVTGGVNDSRLPLCRTPAMVQPEVLQALVETAGQVIVAEVEFARRDSTCTEQIIIDLLDREGVGGVPRSRIEGPRIRHVRSTADDDDRVGLQAGQVRPRQSDICVKHVDTTPKLKT